MLLCGVESLAIQQLERVVWVYLVRVGEISSLEQIQHPLFNEIYVKKTVRKPPRW